MQESGKSHNQLISIHVKIREKVGSRKENLYFIMFHAFFNLKKTFVAKYFCIKFQYIEFYDYCYHSFYYYYYTIKFYLIPHQSGGRKAPQTLDRVPPASGRLPPDYQLPHANYHMPTATCQLPTVKKRIPPELFF